MPTSKYKDVRTCECGYNTFHPGNWSTHKKRCKLVVITDRELISNLKEQLAAKDEQMKEQLAAKDQQMKEHSQQRMNNSQRKINRLTNSYQLANWAMTIRQSVRNPKVPLSEK